MIDVRPFLGRAERCRRVILSACVISVGIHAGVAAMSSLLSIEPALAAPREEEQTAFRIRVAAGNRSSAASDPLDLRGAAVTASPALATDSQGLFESNDVVKPAERIDELSECNLVVRNVSVEADLPASVMPSFVTARRIEPAELDSVVRAAMQAVSGHRTKARGSQTTAMASPRTFDHATSQPRMGPSTRANGSEQGSSGRSGSGLSGSIDSDNVASSDAGRLVLDAPAPSYPDASARRGEEGTVLCELHVAVDGRVIAVGVLQSSQHPRLDAAAVAALMRWRFEPVREQERAITARIKHRVSFRLE